MPLLNPTAFPFGRVIWAVGAGWGAADTTIQPVTKHSIDSVLTVVLIGGRNNLKITRTPSRRWAAKPLHLREVRFLPPAALGEYTKELVRTARKN